MYYRVESYHLPTAKWEGIYWRRYEDILSREDCAILIRESDYPGSMCQGEHWFTELGWTKMGNTMRHLTATYPDHVRIRCAALHMTPVYTDQFQIVVKELT